ncbi:GDSL-type esterase/lipase family protein [Sphingomonas sp. KR1UV-12]|uniref:GDSL-type esterase/lipase family protein n=1 Tax=Sphingomonas aurea TaxID=3063994 RepID=A0ABT9EMN9_9SPHN|nr:GDSL-type esterase/lipase family protein [Sphingomonas sp. KR1UV-12]MDP1028087.1 GDSL-type esterase/lipase family protein [Sphingomonas sp. KR1UV-12]
MIDRRTLFGVATLAGLTGFARAQAAPDAAAKRRPEDWAWTDRYAEDNRRRIAAGERAGIVFLGDSITEGWSVRRPAFFTAGRVNRGIGGQTTPQMLVRTMPDVVALRPRVLHLMGGTNDVAGNTGPMTGLDTAGNLTAICQVARANGIAVLLASVPPASGFPWRPGLDPVAPIRAINAWAREHARALGVRFVDYTPVLATPDGAMKPGLAYDGVHPTEGGYDAMASVLEPILRAMRV